MPIEGVDYAWERPSITGLAAVGKRFACRYVGPGSSGKHLDPTEARALAAAGLSIVANAEGTADGLLGGRSIGMSWAASGHDHAVRCGMPPDRPVYLSVDFDVQSGQWAKVRDALDGAGDVLGHARVGVYGGYDAIAWAKRDNVARWYWQTYAWSEGRWHPSAHIRQYRNGVSLVGGTVDLDHAMVGDYGQWRPVGSPDENGETDMALSNADIDKVAEAVRSMMREPEPYISAGVKRWANGRGWPDVTTRGLAEYVWPAIEQAKTAISTVDDKVDALVAKVDGLADRPVADPVALATALLADPSFTLAIAAAVGERLGRIVGELTLTGSADLGIRPDQG
jgi:hypothetical protein